MSRLTPDQLSRIRQRADAATPGPWRHEPAIGAVVSRCVIDGTGYLFAQVDDGQNAEFIAQARTDIPALLSELDLLRTELDASYGQLAKLRTELDEMRAVATAFARYATAKED